MQSKFTPRQLAKSLVPPIVALLAIGCSVSDPVGPASNNDNGSILDEPQNVIADDQVVDIDDIVTPDQTIDNSRSTDLDDVAGPDQTGDASRSTELDDLPEPDQSSDAIRSVDTGDITVPDLTADASRSVNRDDLPEPQQSENLNGRVVDRNEVPSPGSN